MTPTPNLDAGKILAKPECAVDAKLATSIRKIF
jgi:hypothetical protein